jgi:hypothetical protein
MPSELQVYQFEQDTFDARLEEFNLLFTYELPISTPITSLIDRIAGDMQSSSFQYQFAPETRMLLAHEALPLQLLQLVNRGVPRGWNLHIHLRQAVHGNRTIQHLAGDRLRFCIPNITIEGNPSRFVIYFGEHSISLNDGQY